MKTVFLLMAQYDGKSVIPVEDVCRDYFRHLEPEKFLRKALAGEIALPVVRMESSKRAARGVHINDLAAWIDRQTAEARRECDLMRKTA